VAYAGIAFVPSTRSFLIFLLSRPASAAVIANYGIIAQRVYAANILKFLVVISAAEWAGDNIEMMLHFAIRGDILVFC